MAHSLFQGNPLLGFVAGHPFEQVPKLGCCGEALVYFPKVPFVFMCKSLVVGVFEVSAAEGLQFHRHEEMRGGCGEDVRLDPVVAKGGRLLLKGPKFGAVVRFTTNSEVALNLGVEHVLRRVFLRVRVLLQFGGEVEVCEDES